MNELKKTIFFTEQTNFFKQTFEITKVFFYRKKDFIEQENEQNRWDMYNNFENGRNKFFTSGTREDLLIILFFIFHFAYFAII